MKKYALEASSNSPKPMDSANLEENPAPKEQGFSYHGIVWKHFGKLLLDVPFPILILFTLWRMPKLIYKLVGEVSF